MKTAKAFLLTLVLSFAACSFSGEEAQSRALKLLKENKTVEALDLLSKCSEKGDAGCMYLLGSIYYNGSNGVQPDYEKALSLNQSAYEGRDKNWLAACQSAELLGFQYQYGQGVGRDFIKAREWFQRGYALCEKSSAGKPVGEMVVNCSVFKERMAQTEYTEGVQLLNEKSRKSLLILSLCAKNGHGGCMQVLGSVFYKGEMTARDYLKSIMWNQKAYETGINYGMAGSFGAGMIGGQYRDGKGVQKDLEKARDWFQKAYDLCMKFDSQTKETPYRPVCVPPEKALSQKD